MILEDNLPYFYIIIVCIAAMMLCVSQCERPLYAATPKKIQVIIFSELAPIMAGQGEVLPGELGMVDYQ